MRKIILQVYCGMISECTNEDTLIPMFAKNGDLSVWDIKLMTDPSKRHHRGFAFVRYLKPGHALVAVREVLIPFHKICGKDELISFIIYSSSMAST